MKTNDATMFFSAPLPQILTVGKVVFGTIWSDNLHNSNHCELLMPLGSQLTVTYQDGRQYRANCGEVLIIPPETPHRDLFSRANESTVFYCSFDWNKTAEYLSIANNDTLSGISKRTCHDLRAIFDGICSDLAGGTEMDRMISSTRLFSSLMILLRDVLADPENTKVAGTKNRKRKLINDAKRYVEANYIRCISLAEIAEALNVSSYYLSHVFSEGNGFPLFEYLLEVRMKRAGELFCEGKLNVAQVAYAVGYEDPNYFSRTFKKYYGTTPSKWRNNATE